MATTGLRYERLMDGRIWRRYEVSTGETVEVWAPWKFDEDFKCQVASYVVDTTPAAGSPWMKVDTNTGAAVQVAANAAEQINGAWELVIGADNNAALSAMYFKDLLSVPLTAAASATRGLQIEFRFKVTSANLTGITVQLGIMSEHNDAVGSVAEKAWFYLDESLVLACQTDDASVDSGIVPSSSTLVTATWYIGRIDLSDLADVKFYLDGTRLCASTTFDMSSMAASHGCQPVLAVRKAAAGTATATLDVDYVRAWALRFGE